MTRRLPACRVLAVTFIVAATAVRALAQPADRPPVRVMLEPTMVDQISGVAWNALVSECRTLWAREGIDVSWPGRSNEGAPATVTLPLVFDDRELRTHDPANREALGVTVFAGRAQRILVSAARARRLVAMHHGLADSGDAMSLDIAVGRLLGRVVAHEVGHALLLTTAHSTYGLMSPQLVARDAGPLVDQRFALSAAERDRLAMRFSSANAPEQRVDTSATATTGARGATAAPREAAAVEKVTWRDAPPAPSQLRAPR